MRSRQDHFPVCNSSLHEYFSLFDEAEPAVKTNGVDLRVQEQIALVILSGDFQ